MRPNKNKQTSNSWNDEYLRPCKTLIPCRWKLKPPVRLSDHPYSLWDFTLLEIFSAQGYPCLYPDNGVHLTMYIQWTCVYKLYCPGWPVTHAFFRLFSMPFRGKFSKHLNFKSIIRVITKKIWKKIAWIMSLFITNTSGKNQCHSFPCPLW